LFLKVKPAIEECKRGGVLIMKISYQVNRLAFICLLICLIASCLPICAQAIPASEPKIDLRAGTLNGKAIPEWTLDQVTDVLLRPTAVTPGYAGITGVQTHYHTRGLSFWFKPKEKDPSQKLSILSIYLSRSWDKESMMWYEIYKGGLIPIVDANWKLPQVLKEFATYNLTVKTVEESRIELEKFGVGVPQTDFVNFNVNNKLRVAIAIEPNTKFVETIYIHVLN
jgi:hypothetical protein